MILSARALTENRRHIQSGPFEGILLKGHSTKARAGSNRDSAVLSVVTAWHLLIPHLKGEGAEGGLWDGPRDRNVAAYKEGVGRSPLIHSPLFTGLLLVPPIGQTQPDAHGQGI